MLSPTTTAIIRRQVAWRFDCEPGDLYDSYPVVKAHGVRLAGYQGIYVWQMDDIAVISAPPEWVSVARRAVVRPTSGALVDPDFWRAVLGAHIERIVGPSYQGYVDAAAFRPAPPLPPGPPALLVRVLAPADLPALEDLATACPPQEWQDSAIHRDHTPIFVLEQSGVLVAVASAPGDGPGIASVGAITHPAWRGRSYGAAVVSALTANRLADGAVLHYQTLRANLASVAVARALGYRDLATALGVRLQR
jgi:GNAT superfamily N-acetyltransferase